MLDSGKGVKKFAVLAGAVFCAFLTLGIPLAILPGQIRDRLGFSTFIVGVVIGIQSLSTVCTRHFAGSRADQKGAKTTVQIGLWLCSLAGLTYLLSYYFIAWPSWSLLVLILGRLLLGLGESFLITGALMWGIGLVGASRSGQVMAWNGIAMYGALALGTPLGLWLQTWCGFRGAMFFAMLFPLLGLGLSSVIPEVNEKNRFAEREPFFKIIRQIWIYGSGMGLGTIGFGALTSFIVLYFKDRGWGNAGVALLIFGGCYVSVRIVAGHLPDRTGGRKVAIISLLLEACGQALIWFAPSLTFAYIGTALTGFGYSLVFPSFGVQVARIVPAHSRGSALGTYFAFFDIALGLSGPVCGAVASFFGLPAAYAVGTFSCLLGAFIAFSLKTRSV